MFYVPGSKEGEKVRIQVKSVHHQGIHKLGEDLKVQAICPEDGLVEAISGGDEEQILGIQWHPEFFTTIKTPCIDRAPLLDHFISLCRKSEK